MNYTNFSRIYQVRFLRPEDVPEIFRLCAKNRQFYQFCPPFVTEASIRQDMKALPPRKTWIDKYYLGYFNTEQELVAVLDLIDHYPDEKTCFIGFFMMERKFQEKGIGSAIVSELCAFLSHAGYQNLRLGYVDGNEQSRNFWRKNQFAETGVRVPTENYTIVAMDRDLVKTRIHNQTTQINSAVGFIMKK